MRLLFSFLILVSFLNASIVLNEGIDKIDDFQMLYYNDTTGSLGINNISKLDFNQTISNAFAFGYIKGKSWFKITLVNNTDKEDFLLHMNDAWLYELNLYSFEASKIEKIENGWKVAIKDKDILDTSPTFNIHIDKGKTKTFYIELDANLGTLGKFVIYLKKASHLKNQLLFIALYMFYFGAAFVVFILNFFLFLTLKERIYLYYSLYALVFSSYILSLEGMTEYVFPNSFLQLAFLSPLSSLILILFSREILETSKLTPKIDKILIFFSVVMLSLTILVYISPLSWFIVYNNILPLPPFVILLASILTWNKAKNDTKLYLLFMLAYIISLFILAFMSLGIIEYDYFSRYTFLVSSFFEITFFSLVLANKFNTTKKAKQLVEVNLKDTEELSNRDALTSLYNRRYLDTNLPHYFNEARRKGQELCVIMLDIDKFKLVNDTYGHSVGDIVLSSVANVFSSLTRESDIAVRYGGEEFVIILSNTSLQNAQVIAEKIRIGIEKTAMKYENDKELFVTMSLGISLLKDEDTSIKSIISRADEALYRSKSTGRNRVSNIK